MKSIAENGRSQSELIDKDEKRTALCRDFSFMVPFGVRSAETIPVIFALLWTTYLSHLIHRHEINWRPGLYVRYQRHTSLSSSTTHLPGRQHVPLFLSRRPASHLSDSVLPTCLGAEYGALSPTAKFPLDCGNWGMPQNAPWSPSQWQSSHTEVAFPPIAHQQSDACHMANTSDVPAVPIQWRL